MTCLEGTLQTIVGYEVRDIFSVINNYVTSSQVQGKTVCQNHFDGVI